MFVYEDDFFMRLAKEHARKFSKDAVMPNAGVLVSKNFVIGKGANGSDYHDTHGCERIRRQCKSGEGYDLCEGCHQKNHGEAQTIANARSRKLLAPGADLYFWGHWWCCKDCWEVIRKAKIRNVILLVNSHILFNREHSENIIGSQFKD